MVKKGIAFPLLPCKHHLLTVESMLGSGCNHHFFRDEHVCILCKGLALLLLAHVDGEWNVGIDSLFEIGDVVIEIRLDDLCVCSANAGDKLP